MRGACGDSCSDHRTGQQQCWECLSQGVVGATRGGRKERGRRRWQWDQTSPSWSQEAHPRAVAVEMEA